MTQQRQQTNGNGDVNKAVLQRFTSFSAADQASGASLGWVHPSSNDLRVADDGQMAVENNGWGAGLSKRAWTTPTLIGSANSILSSQGSHAKLIVQRGGEDLQGGSRYR